MQYLKKVKAVNNFINFLLDLSINLLFLFLSFLRNNKPLIINVTLFLSYELQFEFQTLCIYPHFIYSLYFKIIFFNWIVSIFFIIKLLFRVDKCILCVSVLRSWLCIFNYKIVSLSRFVHAAYIFFKKLITLFSYSNVDFIVIDIQVSYMIYYYYINIIAIIWHLKSNEKKKYFHDYPLYNIITLIYFYFFKYFLNLSNPLILQLQYSILTLLPFTLLIINDSTQINWSCGVC